MKSFLSLFVLSLTIFLIGCKTSGHVVAGESSRLQIGMSREEVIHSIGKPDSVSAHGNEETLNYILERQWWQDVPFRIKLVDGKIVSFGPEERPK